jgi:hypothetical protein
MTESVSLCRSSPGGADLTSAPESWRTKVPQSRSRVSQERFPGAEPPLPIPGSDHPAHWCGVSTFDRVNSRSNWKQRSILTSISRANQITSDHYSKARWDRIRPPAASRPGPQQAGVPPSAASDAVPGWGSTCSGSGLAAPLHRLQMRRLGSCPFECEFRHIRRSRSRAPMRHATPNASWREMFAALSVDLAFWRSLHIGVAWRA